MNSRELIRIKKTAGTRSSSWQSTKKGRTVPYPEATTIGTLKSVERQAGIKLS